jgi:hypothetical protein
MDFSKMRTQDVARVAERVCQALNGSRIFSAAYYRIHDGNVPVIYATVLSDVTVGDVRVTIRSDAIEAIAERMEAQERHAAATFSKGAGECPACGGALVPTSVPLVAVCVRCGQEWG